MFRKIILASLALSFAAAPSFAASDYYVSKNTKSAKCSIMDTVPDGTVSTQVGDQKYASKAEAETAMAAATECK